MDIILLPLLHVVYILINLYMNIVVLSVIFSWLLVFGILKNSNRYVYLIGMFFYKATEPLLYRIRRVIPPIMNIDFSPFILLLGLIFVQEVIARIAVRLG